ncbi:Tyrosine-protein phosphatase non-receptor type 23 [Schistosoma haematobium]|uniref:Tyrosine-protein phosphatase non-receptor type 23 n=1 Tax=Schistosoma haematobium TaxID=6185 RepID=A0A922LZZ8_SCHHA|nr:Tyrosine-protein phosphatase non-receptor type 23 [Schistosoma haematobium]KAH9596931.1 Tyrosine-protein phosphatase non-receptor type 23 [Schistosoma haematobium]
MCTDVTWKWQDIFSDCLLESSDIRLEEASIMYNIAALHSILGVKERRADADSMKIACTHFQCASWALNTLVERHLPVSGATDLTSELMLLFGSLMLAQAQECVVEKSILDNRPANVTAKLSQYIMEVYENIGAQLLGFDSNDKLVLPKYSKEWRRRCQIKTNFYSSLTAYYAGINEEENKVYGKAIAWFQLANNHMEECKTNAKNFKDSDNLSMMASGGTYRASAIYAGEVISNKLTSSTKDNDFIYHELIPKIESLEQTKGVCIVKGVPFDHNDTEVRGPDIFHRLIPMNVLESASIYSEMKASLLRTLTGEVDIKEDELDKFLSTLYLDSTKMLAPDPPFPQSLYNLFARMDAVDRDPSGELSKQLKSLVNLSVDGDSEFENLSLKMKDVEEFFNILVTTKGSEKPKNFSVIVKNFKERFKNLSDANQQAKQSNNQLKELITNQLKSFDDTLKISLEEFIKKLPSVNDLITDSTLNNISKESQRLFDKVNEMRQQRIELINKLRTNLHIDDVDSDLLIISDQDKQDLNSWFENRLKTKHDHLVNIIKQNLKAQENIQSALIDLNAEFAPKWTELSEIRTKRSEQIDNILVAGEAFDGILSKSKQGIDFYITLINQLKDLDKEVDHFIEDLNKQLRLSMDELSKPISNLTIETTPRLPTVSTPSFPTLGDYMKAMRPTTVPTHPNMYMGPMGWPVSTLTSSQPNQQLNLPPNPVTASSQFPTTSISPNHSVVNSFIPSVSPDVYYQQTNVSQPFPYYPTSQPRFRGPMTYTPLYNSQQFPTTGVNIQPTAVPMPGSSYAAGFQTTNPMQTAVRPSPTVTYGAPQAANMVNTLVPPCQRPITSLPQTTNMSPSQPNNLPGTFESRFLPNNPRIPVLSSTTTSSLSQFPIPVNSRFSQPNNFIQTSIRSTNPLVPPNYSSANSNQFPPQSVWPNQLINNNLTYQNPPQNYSKTLPTGNFGMVGIQYPQSNLSFPNTLSYQKPIPHINNSPVNSGQISIASQQSYTTLPNHNQAIRPVSQCNTNVTTQSLLPTNVTQTHPTSQYTDSNSNNSTEQKPNQITPFNSVLDTDNDAYLSSSRLKSMSPIEPQVLTKDDLDAKLREERLREAYSGNPNSPSIPSSTSNLIKSLSSSSSSNPTNVNESKNPSLNPVKSDSFTSSTVTSNPVNCQSVLSKFPPPELLSDPLVLNRFIASAELLLTWLENPNELISTGDSDCPVTSLSNLTNTNTITRLNKAWQKVQTLANAFTTSVYFNGKRPTHAIALCCPSKNRNQDFVPYDNNRVVLKSLKNDYINASHIDFQNNLGIWCPRYIITQAPMIKTMIDFWTMILEQSCEIIVTLIPTRVNRTVNSFYSSISSGEGAFGDENDPLRIPAYLPVNKTGARLLLPGSNLEIRLQSIKQSYIEGNVISQDNSDNNDNNNNDIDTNDSNRHLTSSTQHHPWTERIITVQDLNTKITRSLVHLTYHHQFPLNIPLSNNNNSSINDPNIVQLVAFINHVHSYYKQQRNLIRPIAVVCEYGAELSGIFVTASVGILHADMLGRMSDVFTIAGYLCQQRHGVLNNSCQLYTAARLIGYSAIETVAKKDVVIGPRHRPSSTITTTTTLTTTTTTNNSKTSNAITNSAQFNLTNSLDNIFSKQSLKLGDLISVVDKWSVSTKSESITSSSVETEDKFVSSNVENNDSNQATLKDEMPVNVEQQQQQQSTNELNVNPSTIVSLSDNQSNLLSQSSEINKSTYESKLPEHLVNLNNLTKNSTNNKRYTRQDFQDLSNSTTTNTTELYHHEIEFNSNDDPLNKLDPLWNSKLLDHSVNS